MPLEFRIESSSELLHDPVGPGARVRLGAFVDLFQQILPQGDGDLRLVLCAGVRFDSGFVLRDVFFATACICQNCTSGGKRFRGV